VPARDSLRGTFRRQAGARQQRAHLARRILEGRRRQLLSGQCAVERHAHKLGGLDTGDCFGEASYVQGAKRTATIRAANAVTVLKVSSTLLEQVSASCQLRFNRVFLRTLIGRLQSGEQPTTN